jgi:hypothetical protein
MSQTPFEQAGALRIGTVDFVSPDEIKAILEIEAPESVAMNTGGPRPFPRVNGYLLMPVDDGFLVGQIEWLTVERSSFPKRRGLQDFGLVDLPFPLRRLSMNPIGTLLADPSNTEAYKFRRGSDALPSIGTQVVLPTKSQLRSIVESRQHVTIGTSVLADNAMVSVDPNKIFGRHLAVLGNTGSGKSCSVAGIIRWCIEAAQKAQCAIDKPSTRFIILDPNGEYSRAFQGKDLGKTRIFRVMDDADENVHPLRVPLWLWNSSEWAAFTQASSRAQKPFLKKALRDIKSGRPPGREASDEDNRQSTRRYLTSRLISVRRFYNTGGIQSDATKFGYFLKALESDLQAREGRHPGVVINSIRTATMAAISANRKSFKDKQTGETVEFFTAFTEAQAQSVLVSIESVLAQLGGTLDPEGPDEDAPVHFKGCDFVDHLEVLMQAESNPQFIESLVARVRTLVSDRRMKGIIDDSHDLPLDAWLKEYVGSSDQNDPPVRIIDLSLVPAEVIHVIAAVIARMCFESVQRHMRSGKRSLPTVLVMEEAHTFIKRYRDEVESADTASVCCQVFERISREGRKFGLGLVLSSQRPAELSPTVLSQCNTFLLHRISNDRDQDIVHRLVPDNLKGLLRELPSLPPQSAILLGWASELPVLVRMRSLPQNQQPRSDDPDYWGSWTGVNVDGEKLDLTVDWTQVARDWQGIVPLSETQPPGHNPKPDADGVTPLF